MTIREMLMEEFDIYYYVSKIFPIYITQWRLPILLKKNAYLVNPYRLEEFHAMCKRHGFIENRLDWKGELWTK